MSQLLHEKYGSAGSTGGDEEDQTEDHVYDPPQPEDSPIERSIDRDRDRHALALRKAEALSDLVGRLRTLVQQTRNALDDEDFAGAKEQAHRLRERASDACQKASAVVSLSRQLDAEG